VSQRAAVVVVGAGPGGSATAAYLARAGVDVLLLDRAGFPRDKTCGDCLSARALDVLDEMGLLAGLLPRGQAIVELDITAPNGRSVGAAVPRRAGPPPHLLVVPRQILDDRIRQGAVEAGARFLDRTRVVRVQTTGSGVVVEAERLGAAFRLTAQAAVVATGASTSLLQRSDLLPRMPPVGLAARAYFEDVAGLDDRVQLRLDHVPLPGYGWLFPVSPTVANIGVGFPAPTSTSEARARRPRPQDALERFLRASPVRRQLSGARRIGPVKGYPLRMDFGAAPTSAGRVLLVGEAAGLVNPLSGEGVDYALESGRLAAGHLAAALAAGDLTASRRGAYDDELRDRFADLFAFCRRVSALCGSATCLNALVWAAGRQGRLKSLLVDVVLGYQEVAGRLTPGRMLRAALGV
jgi:geranylgeranyl reductase family protein